MQNRTKIQTVKVSLKENSYTIFIGKNILPQLGGFLRTSVLGEDAVVISNRFILKHHGRKLLSTLRRNGFAPKVIEVADSEKSKSTEVALQVLKKIAAYDIKKKIFIVAFGGGVVGDLAGYIASVYRRGVPYLQVPTSFLAQIDSAIGGKVGIDLPMGKNLVGSFYQPRLVLSDVLLLATLNRRQIQNGLAEVVKYGVIYDNRLFSYVERNYRKLLAVDTSVLMEVVLRCSRIKAAVVADDEKETKGIRTIFNFGHTIGHAIEAAGGYTLYHHGEAVALGMRVAANMAVRMNLLGTEEFLRLQTLLSAIGLPEKIKKLNAKSILKAMAHDKKFSSRRNKFVLPVKIGRVKILEGVPSAVIRQALETYL